MNPNVWNIKEILSIPTGSSGTKSTNWNTCGYSSVTDSQFVFGSQFWPENSQGTSQEMSFSSRTSQQSSQEGNDPKFLSNYHTKPLLFGGEVKDKCNVQKAIGILDKFEEDKKKAKEKSESDILGKECLHFRETLNNMQQSIIGTEKNTAVCKTILDEFNNFATALQKNLSSLQNGLSQQFETMLNEVSSQKQMLTEMEERVYKTGVATTELGSHVHSLKKNLEDLTEEQVREHNMLEEALNLLSTLVSKHSTKLIPGRVSDSAIQTSPGVVQPFSIQQNSQPDGRQLLECSQGEVPSRDSQSSCIIGKRSTLRARRRHRKRPLLLPQRSKGTIWGKNCQPPTNHIKQVSSPLKELYDPNRVTSVKPDSPIQLNRETRSNKGVGGFISPLIFWSQDSNSTAYITNIEPSLEKLSAESKTEIPGKAKGLWQLFDITCDSDPFLVEEE